MMQAGETPSSLTTLEQKIGHPLCGVGVTIDYGNVRAEQRRVASPYVTDRWSVGHLRGLHALIDCGIPSRPDHVNAGTLNAPVGERA